MEKGIYYNLTNQEYHAGAGISKSQLDDINLSPAHYIWKKNAPIDEQKTKSLDIGSAFHCLLLEPDEYKKRFIVAPEFNRRTNEGKKNEADFIKECQSFNKIVISHEDQRKLELMQASTLAHPLAKWLIEAEGKSEASIYWNDSDTNILCRCRPDKIITAHHWIVDLKTSAEMERLQTKFYDYRYHVQDAFYSDGYLTHFGEIPTFCFLVVSTTINCGRYPVTVVVLDKIAKAVGRQSYQQNLQVFQHCTSSNEWPGIQTLSLPYWSKELKELSND